MDCATCKQCGSVDSGQLLIRGWSQDSLRPGKMARCRVWLVFWPCSCDLGAQVPICPNCPLPQAMQCSSPDESFVTCSKMPSLQHGGTAPDASSWPPRGNLPSRWSGNSRNPPPSCGLAASMEVGFAAERSLLENLLGWVPGRATASLMPAC